MSFLTSGGNGRDRFPLRVVQPMERLGNFQPWRCSESPGRGAEQPQAGLDSSQLWGRGGGIKTSRCPFPPISSCEAKWSLICGANSAAVSLFTQSLSSIRLLLDFKIRRWPRQNQPLWEASSFYCCKNTGYFLPCKNTGYLQDLDCSALTKILLFPPTVVQLASMLAN